MNTPPLRGILYGHGHMGQFHAAKLATRDDIQLMIIDPQVGMNPKQWSTPDFAIIATPTLTHLDVAQPLLEDGVPCLVEKPLARNIEEAKRLAQFNHLSVGHIERFNPVFDAIDTIDAEFIEIERLSPFSDRSTDVDVIDDLMIHDLDLLARFMPGTVVDIRAKGIGVMSDRPDIVNARLEIERYSGGIGVVSLTASRISSKSIRTWRLIEPGRYWSLDLRNHKAKVVHWIDQQMNTKHLEVPQVDALTAQHSAFIDAVRQNGPFPCNGTEAVQALELAERIRTCLH